MGRARAWALFVAGALAAGVLLFAGLTAALSWGSSAREDVGFCMVSSHDIAGIPPDREESRAVHDGERITFHNPKGKWHRAWEIEGARLVRLGGDGAPGPYAWQGSGGGGGCAARPMTEEYLVQGSGTMTVREWVLS